MEDDKKTPQECENEIVSTEYLNQPYGTCLECGSTAVKNESDKWSLP